MDIRTRTTGINFINNKTTTINIWAPQAEKIEVQCGKFTISLNKDDFGNWTGFTDLIKAGDLYWVIIDGHKRIPDPASLGQPEGVHGPSSAIDLHYEWTDDSWQNPSLRDYIFYELHTGTYTADGNFQGIINQLDYLVELGITAIEIMPVAAFPGERNWGYDGVFPYAVQWSYGGAAGLQQLVDKCHQKGLAVVLDVVYNHLGPEGNYLTEFGPYFTDKYKTPWGAAVNYDDRYSDGVRKFVIENVLMWFRDFHVDALRLDAVHAIKDFSAIHILQDIRRETDRLIKQTGRMHYLIAESDLNDPRYISGLSENGLGMHAQWTDEFHHALRVSAGEPKTGYYSDFMGIEHLAKAYRDAYVYTGMYSSERARKFGRETTGHPGSQFIVFSQNHDQTGNRMLGSRSGTLYSYEMQKLLAGAVMLSPFLPMLFMGEEYGETNPFLYFVSHTDSELVENVRSGRKQEFAAMHLEGEAPDPQDPVTMQQSRLNWSLLKEKHHQVMLLFYQAIIALHKRHAQIHSDEKELTRCTALKELNCLLLERSTTGSSELIFCLMNFSVEIQQISIPVNIKLAGVIFNSAAQIWGGPGDLSAARQPEHQQISIQPESFIVYQANYV
ncbi:malto-oligosyltrehalose trehalohydrolase [Pedobacter antarcticus]|uniref:malto-oligosyltrehalose trehalohydrolase n=1 Tax=Pedobacter antarcticus TaxID=34086 RepID=UPI00292D034B|nr:malto-oligosyltrehalose trehalohydrolase [Pedobacter antarcticus]